MRRAFKELVKNAERWSFNLGSRLLPEEVATSLQQQFEHAQQVGDAAAMQRLRQELLDRAREQQAAQSAPTAAAAAADEEFRANLHVRAIVAQLLAENGKRLAAELSSAATGQLRLSAKPVQAQDLLCVAAGSTGSEIVRIS